MSNISYSRMDVMYTSLHARHNNCTFLFLLCFVVFFVFLFVCLFCFVSFRFVLFCFLSCCCFCCLFFVLFCFVLFCFVLGLLLLLLFLSSWKLTQQRAYASVLINLCVQHKIRRLHVHSQSEIKFTCLILLASSGVARAFPGGRLAHPEGQGEEENK